MFGLFKKKDKIDTGKMVEMALAVFRNMPAFYQPIVKQLEDGIVLKIKKTDSPFENYFKFSLQVKLLNQYENKKASPFVIKGIKVFDINTAGYTEVYFYIAYGLLLGYSTPAVKEICPDNSKINIEQQRLEYFENSDYDAVKKLCTKEELALINSNDVWEVKLNGKIYYHLMDLEDGDFIGIDKDKAAYKITHDPFEITPLDEPLTYLLQ